MKFTKVIRDNGQVIEAIIETGPWELKFVKTKNNIEEVYRINLLKEKMWERPYLPNTTYAEIIKRVKSLFNEDRRKNDNQ